ncbi:hypothetical protein [Dyadobacter sp. CY312]|uniref:hypothetical protein n=1 Tax=Dyadobacter sp. CY312 TaxID=2907303 RepID=UPI001F1CDA57|nr:hypothetical protein [Dyadobacter sp. CY312]MCE7044177.1 hypothetical protein [Dyadobacter sp. CY312]
MAIQTAMQFLDLQMITIKMNIGEELLKYQVQSKVRAIAIAEYASSSDERFRELINCFLSDNGRLAQRAAWSVSWAARKKPDMVQPYIGSLVNQLGRSDVHNAIVRNSLRVLEDIEIPEIYHAQLLNTCFDFIQKRETAIAIKAFSLHVLFNLTKFYPEIKNELKLIIQENIEFETAAFRSRGKKILAKLK